MNECGHIYAHFQLICGFDRDFHLRDMSSWMVNRHVGLAGWEFWGFRSYHPSALRLTSSHRQHQTHPETFHAHPLSTPS